MWIEITSGSDLNKLDQTIQNVEVVDAGMPLLLVVVMTRGRPEMVVVLTLIRLDYEKE